MSYNLFLDDERFPKDVTWVKLPDVEWVIVRDFWEFKNCITERGVPSFVTFDHDLGYTDRSGLDCARYLYEHCLYNNIEMPDRFEVHSMNPVGKRNIEQLVLSIMDEFYDRAAQDYQG